MTPETIQTPEYVILTADEYEKLKNQPVWITFSDLMDMTGLKRDKLDTILKRYRDELDVYNGGSVKFPDGGKWSIEREGMKKWLKENHARIWREDK